MSNHLYLSYNRFEEFQAVFNYVLLAFQV